MSIKIFGCTLGLAACLFAQSLPKVDTLANNGDYNNRINFIYLGDGYTSNLLDSKFPQDVGPIDDHFFKNTTPFKEYANFYNRYLIKKASADTGAGYNTAKAGSAFGAYFNCGGIDRLLCANSTLIYKAMDTLTPFGDQGIVIVNTEKYGGAGGTYATTSLAALAPEIAVHEIGHSFGQLADEYWAGSQYADEDKPNMTQNSNSSTVKWKQWVGTESVGVYAHAESPSWYRPHQNCKMRYLGTQYDFCAVCREAIVDTMWKYVNAIEGYSPEKEATINGEKTFSLNLLRPSPNTVRVVWKLNNQTLSVDTNSSITINYDQLSDGNNELVAEVTDTTELIRNDHHISAHTFTQSWNLAPGEPHTKVFDINAQAASVFRTFLDIIPGHVRIGLESSEFRRIELQWTNTQGRILETRMVEVQPQQRTTIVSTLMSSGVHFLQIKDGLNIKTEKVIMP